MNWILVGGIDGVQGEAAGEERAHRKTTASERQDQPPLRESGVLEAGPRRGGCT